MERHVAYQKYIGLLDIIIIMLPIIIGSLIYLLFRSQTILIFRLIGSLGFSSIVEEARIAARPFNQYFQGFVLYSLPSGLWAFSFIYSITVVWRSTLKSLGAIATILSVMVVVEGTELAQGLGLISGKFDRLDLIANLVGLVVGGAVGYGRRNDKLPTLHR
jgi:hypothetical protein